MITPAVYSDFLLQKTGLDWESFEANATGSGISLASVWLYSLFNPDEDRYNGSEVMCLVYIYQNICSGYFMIVFMLGNLETQNLESGIHNPEPIFKTHMRIQNQNSESRIQNWNPELRIQKLAY